MTENVKFENDNENKTGDICSETGYYFCDMHPYMEEFVIKGDRFPTCSQKGMPHNTSWNKIVKENKL